MDQQILKAMAAIMAGEGTPYHLRQFPARRIIPGACRVPEDTDPASEGYILDALQDAYEVVVGRIQAAATQEECAEQKRDAREER